MPDNTSDDDFDISSGETESDATWFTRRRVLSLAAGGLGLVVVASAVGVELVAHEVLPGKGLLNSLDGACDVTTPRYRVGPTGPTIDGAFQSAARRREVGYTIAYPPGHIPGEELPLVVMLHGEGGSHRSKLADFTPAQCLAIRGESIRPFAMVTVDGGLGYWNPHPRDDPLSMLVDELIPLCQRGGLGRRAKSVGAMGISMGGYGALLLAERHPDLIGAVAAISPAVWTSYSQARAVNRHAYASPSHFAWADAVTHTASLRGIPVRVGAGVDDPFAPGVRALAQRLPPDSTVVWASGCHTWPFFATQLGPSLRFLSQHLA